MKKIKIVMFFIAFGLAFLGHFIYQWMPNALFSIMFPVNESVWEHMKIIVTPLLISAIIEYFYLKHKKISVNNFTLSYAITSVLGIIIYLIIYLPLEAIFSHSMVLAISSLAITFILCEIINYYLLQTKNIKGEKIIGIIIIVLIYCTFGYLTYKPIKNKLFFDPKEKIYGIKKEG